MGLRDRAVLGVLAYRGARIAAMARLRVADYRNLGDHRVLRFREKGGKDREIPVRHDLAAWLNEYIAAAGIAEEPKAPLFRAADGKRRALIDSAYTAHFHASDDEAAARGRVIAFVFALQPSRHCRH